MTPPVFIVVCNNTNVSKLVFDYIAGWEKRTCRRLDGRRPRPTAALQQRAKTAHGGPRPNTILVDSEQLESGEAMSAEFKKIAAREIDEFKAEYRARFPGRDAEDLTDEDLLREVMNTVGKPGKLGEHVQCVVSVSMLTEGWDANTVTHVLGVRAFGTQLLCEQVVGRGLRRMSYAANAEGRFEPEYAEVYGVPFSFIPCSGSIARPQARPDCPPASARLESRIACEITFPRLLGYRYEWPTKRLTARRSPTTPGSRSPRPTSRARPRTPRSSAKAASTRSTTSRSAALNEVAFLLAKLTLEKYFRQDGETGPRSRRPPIRSEVQAWLFPQVLAIAKRWLDECVHCKDNTFPQLLLLIEFAHDAADRIYTRDRRGSNARRRPADAPAHPPPV